MDKGTIVPWVAELNFAGANEDLLTSGGFSLTFSLTTDDCRSFLLEWFVCIKKIIIKIYVAVFSIH